MILFIILITGLALSIAYLLASRREKKLAKELKKEKDYSNALWRDHLEVLKERRELVTLCCFSAKDSFIIKSTSHGIAVFKKIADKDCVIKEFTDPDQDFNRRQAEELIEKLNEK